MAVGAGAHVDFNSSFGTVTGGALATSTGGVINVNNSVLFDGGSAGALSTSANVQVADKGQLQASGMIGNSGTIGLDRGQHLAGILWTGYAARRRPCDPLRQCQ
jgi:hypothetical protein